MSNLYEQMHFILSGGALRYLVEFLTPRTSSALIVRPKDADLEILDAVGAAPGDLFLKGWSPKLASVFPERAKDKKFEVSFVLVGYDPVEGEWPWAVGLRGRRWTFYILLREPPTETMIADLHPIAGLIALWQDFQYMQEAEERLSRMSYMILATKSTLASIFEPMQLEYYASLLTDVLNESLFPRSLSIFKDDGDALSLIEGEDQPPEREGVYVQKMLPPAPIVTKKDSSPYEVVLPLIEPHRLFCVTTWNKMPEKETMDFLELVGNLASRAMSINSLKSEESKISAGKYTIFMLSEALNAMKTRKNRQELLAMTADVFTEMTKVDECLIVAWEKKLQGYVPFEYRKGNIKAHFEPLVLPSDRLYFETETQFFDLTTREFFEILACPWPEMSSMKLAFPIWDRGQMKGFIAVSSSYSTLKDEDKLFALIIVAQFAAFFL